MRSLMPPSMRSAAAPDCAVRLQRQARSTPPQAALRLHLHHWTLAQSHRLAPSGMHTAPHKADVSSTVGVG